MAINTAEMRQARHKILTDARAILNKADAEKRAINTEERSAWDKAWADAETKRVEIEDAERRNELEVAEAELELRKLDEAKKAEKPEERTTYGRPCDTVEYRTAFDSYLRGNVNADEQRALSAGTGTAGGYLYAPETFVTELIKNVTDATIFRQMARVLPPIPGTDSLGAAALTDRMSAAEWTSELGKPSRDSTLAFGKRALTPHPLAKEIVVSKVLLRKVPNAQSIVREELARVCAEAMENAYMTGTGVQQPLGIFTASDDGISTGRDVSTGNTGTSMTFDGLKAAKYTLKQAYWTSAQWIMHRDGMQQIAKLKDGNGRYLLQDSVVAGEPERLLNFPVRLSEYAPNTFTTGLYTAMFGDFREAYWIVDSLDMEIVRAEELLVRTNQDLFVMRANSDGAPVKEEAVVRVTLG